MEFTTLNIKLSKSNSTYRFDFPDSLKFHKLTINVTSNGIEVPKLNQSRYKVVDVEKNIVDIFFDENIFDDEYSNTDLDYFIYMTLISTLDHNRKEYEDMMIYKGKITIS